MKKLKHDTEEGKKISLALFEKYHKHRKFAIAYNFNIRLFARKSILQDCLKWAIVCIEKNYIMVI